MIPTLLITILVEGAVVIGYSLRRRKPVAPILSTSIVANLITQLGLWVVLNLFFSHYLTALLVSEAMIWIAESFFLYFIPANRLQPAEAISLSLAMNLFSFAAGWLLPL